MILIESAEGRIFNGLSPEITDSERLKAVNELFENTNRFFSIKK